MFIILSALPVSLWIWGEGFIIQSLLIITIPNSSQLGSDRLQLDKAKATIKENIAESRWVYIQKI